MRPPRWSGWLAAAAAVFISALALGAAYSRGAANSRGATRTPRRFPRPRCSRTGRIGSFGCYACHPSVFPQALVGFTHAEMREGQFCGRCHDGRTAFAIPGAACARCHVDGH